MATPKRLTKKLSLEIRKLILQNMSYVNIHQALEIPEGTWDYWYWNNTTIGDTSQGFRDFVNNTLAERRVAKAGWVIEGTMDDEDKRLRLDAAKFTAETLGKEHYSKKNDMDITSQGDKLSNGVIVLPKKDADQMETTTEAEDSAD